jgi:hypothetical protein
VSADRRVPRRWDALYVAGLLVVGAGIPVVLGLVAGSLDIPRNDDWVYRNIAMELATTGSLQLHGVTTMMVGHLLLVQPLLWITGLEPSAFTTAGVLFAIAAVLAGYALARQFLRPARATLATLLLLLVPGYLAYATSFMTDVPALVAQLGCLALGAIALGQRPVRTGWLTASLAIGFVGVTFREFAVAAPASVALCAIVAEPRRRRHWVMLVAVACSFVLLFLLKAALSDQALNGGVGSGSWVGSSQALSSLCLVLLPAALVSASRWRHRWSRTDLLIGANIGAVAFAVRLLSSDGIGAMVQVTLPNLASQWGSPARSYLIGGRPLLFGDLAWLLIQGLALVATVTVSTVGAGVVGAYLRRNARSFRTLAASLGSPVGLLVAYSCAVTIGLAVYGMRWPLYDRYLWALVLPLAALLLYSPQRQAPRTPAGGQRRKAAAVVPVVAVASFSAVVALTFMLNSFAFDAARWRAGERLVQLGYAADQIDAGYEWVGFHATSPAKAPEANGDPFYATWWPSRQTCAIVTSEMPAALGDRLLGTIDYPLNLVAGPTERLFLYGVQGTECTPR